MAERSGEHPRNENIRDGRLRSLDFINGAAVELLRIEQARLIDKALTPDSALDKEQINDIVEESINTFLRENGAESDFEGRDKVVAVLKETAITKMRGQDWDSSEEGRPSGLDLIAQLREELEKANEEEETGEAKSEIPDVLSDREITTLREMAIEEYRRMLAGAKRIYRDNPDPGYDTDEKIEEAAKESTKRLMTGKVARNLADHGIEPSDPRFEEMRAFLVLIANAAIDDPTEWSKSIDRGGSEEETGLEWANRVTGSMARASSDSEKTSVGDAAIEAEDSLRELGEQLTTDMQRAADLLAKRMKRGDKFSLEDQEELDKAYAAYNKTAIAFSKALMSDVMRSGDEEAIAERATSCVIEVQSVFRATVQDAYLSNPWRKGVAKSAELWNHEDWKKKWGFRMALGGAVGAIVLMPGGFTAGATTLLGVAAKGAAMGAGRGALIGGMSKFLGKANHAPGMDAEDDFDFSKVDKDAFARELDKTLGDIASANEAAVRSEANEVASGMAEARSFKNVKGGIAKGALIGAAVGATAGVVRYAATDGQMPHPVRAFNNWAESRGNAPSTHSTVADTPGSGKPSMMPHPTTSGAHPSGAPGAEMGHGNGGHSGHEGGSSSSVEHGGSSTAPEHGHSGGGTEHHSAGSETSPNHTVEVPNGASPEIHLNEGPYSIFDRLGVPRNQWEHLYRSKELLAELKSHGDAYALTEQGHGFGWAHAGKMNPESIKAIYRVAGMNRGNFDLAS